MKQRVRAYPYDSNICGVYIVKNKITGQAYVGQSTNIHNRWNRHIRDAKAKVNAPLYDAMAQYGIDNFEFNMLKIINISIPSLRDSLLYGYEKLYISRHNTAENGYNLTYGGKSNVKFTSESIERMKVAHKELADVTRKQAREDAERRRIQRVAEYKTIASSNPHNWVDIITRDYGIRKKSLRIYIKNHIPELLDSYENATNNDAHTLIQIERIRADNPTSWVPKVNDVLFPGSPRRLYRFLKRNNHEELYKEYRYQIYKKEN